MIIMSILEQISEKQHEMVFAKKKEEDFFKNWES